MPTEPIVPQAEGPSGVACRVVGDVVLACSGELDATTIPALHQSLQLLLDLGPARVVVDLSGVTFFDAGAIGELVDARTKRRAAGGDLVLRAPSEFGRWVLGAVGQSSLVADASPGAPTWGCAWIATGGVIPPDRGRAAELLEQADRRMLELRSQAPASGAAVEALGSAGELAGRFTEANRSSVLIDAARGAIAQHFGIGIDEASIMLRTFATTRGRSVVDTATALMDRTVAFDDLSSHTPSMRT